MGKTRALTAQEIQDIDRMAIEEYGVPSLILMENAGRLVAEEVRKAVRSKRSKEISVVCGCGNNAGDGFAAARYLLNAGLPVKVFLVDPSAAFKHDPLIHFQILKKMGASFSAIENEKVFRDSSVIIDAVFGVGLNREIRDPFYSAIDRINRSKKKIIAVDIPSGLDATTGKTWGISVKADVTVTFSFAKKGFYVHEGPQQAGRIKVVDIGIPRIIMKNFNDRQ